MCVSADDCAAAERGGADRVELVSAIEMGGLTPSLGTVMAAREVCRLPMIVMLRPRSGGFCFSPGEFAGMKHDARRFAEIGVEGFVTGILKPDKRIDAERCLELMTSVDRPVEWVFHRAFDVTPDPFAALETLIELEFKRLLTSGQRATVEEGAETLRKLIAAAGGRIEILPGSGVNASNLRSLVQSLGVSQIHATGFEIAPDVSTLDAPIPFNGRETFESGYRATSVDAVRALADLL